MKVVFKKLRFFGGLPAFVEAKRQRRVVNDWFDEDSSNLQDEREQFDRQSEVSPRGLHNKPPYP